jgi:long-chain acyl-CoA synthetase
MSTPPDTMNRHIADAIGKYADRPAVSAKPHGSKEWRAYTYADLATNAREFSLGIRSLGIERGDRVAILSENRPEWAFADVGILAAGAVTVPVYPTLPAAQVQHILADSGAKAVVVSDDKQLKKVEACREACPDLAVVIVIEPAAVRGDALAFDAVLEAGRSSNPAESYEDRRDSVQPSDLMSLVYTSGTTGNPKGAMLTHANFVAALEGIHKALPLTPLDEVFLSFLPLCHVFERVAYSLALSIGAHTYYNDSLFKLADNLAEVHPTIFLCVPRVFESIHERVLDTLAKQPAAEQALANKAIKLGGEYALKRAGTYPQPLPKGKGEGTSPQPSPWKGEGARISPVLAASYAIADKAVLSKIRDKFGGKLKFLVSGGAPLNPATAEFFTAVGIQILEGWGLTETTAASAINPYGRPKFGTVGRADFTADVKTAPDGELLVHGPTVMRGYWNNPEATAEVIDQDGWFHSGDIGEIDTDGYIKITDRKKDILVLANGKKVAPQPIEVNLKRNPYLAEVVLVGDQTGNVSALVLPNYDRLRQWAKDQGKEATDASTLAADPAVRKFIKAQIEEYSGDLAEFEKVKRVALLEKPLSVDDGELTPTLKVRRKVVMEKYGKLLEREAAA